MLNKEQFGEFLVNSIPGAKFASGRRTVLFRCPFCGDSQKNSRSAHFYILLNPESPNMMIRYYCQKCHATGIVDHNTLMEWGVYDSNMNVELSEFNKKVKKEQDNTQFIDRNIYKLDNRFILDNDLSRYKLSYVNKRLGTNLNYNDILSSKIVLNLGDLLDSNKIYSYTRDASILQQLNDNFIGFISRDNAFVNMRNLEISPVHKNIDKRYINYSIFGKFDNSQKYYVLPSQIDITNPRRVRLNIAEGPFDILSVYYNLQHKSTHNIYAAIGGSGYLNLIKSFMIRDKLNYIEVHIYIDNDVKDYVIQNIKDYLMVFNVPLYIHRNMKNGEKDFGVPLDRIEEKIIQLL